MLQHYTLFFDSHYYFPQGFQLDSPRYGTICVTGGNFEPQPGKYLLPLQEGHYAVEPSEDTGRLSPAVMHMVTRGSGNNYTHPIIHYRDPANSYPLGWYTFFSDVTDTAAFSIKRKAAFTFHTGLASP